MGKFIKCCNFYSLLQLLISARTICLLLRGHTFDWYLNVSFTFTIILTFTFCLCYLTTLTQEIVDRFDSFPTTSEFGLWLGFINRYCHLSVVMPRLWSAIISSLVSHFRFTFVSCNRSSLLPICLVITWIDLSFGVLILFFLQIFLLIFFYCFNNL